MNTKTIKLLTVIILMLIIASFGYLFYFKQNENKQGIGQETTRQRDISEIKKFADNQDIPIEFVDVSRSSYKESVVENIYYVGADQYEINANTGKIIQVGTRSLPVGSGKEKNIDNSPKYTPNELESIARQFIAKNASEVDLEKLTPNHGNKDTNYFFRWEDKTQKTTEGNPFIQVGFSQGGTLVGYTNSLGL